MVVLVDDFRVSAWRNAAVQRTAAFVERAAVASLDAGVVGGPQAAAILRLHAVAEPMTYK